MSLREFNENDIYKNVIKVKPFFNINIYSSSININNSTEGNIKMNNLNIPNSNLKSENYYPYILKTSQQENFKNIPTADYVSAQYGDELSSKYPFSSSISVEYYSTASLARPRIASLENSLNNYGIYSQHFLVDSFFGNKRKQELVLIGIPTTYFGSSINRGSVELNILYTGSLVAQLRDSKLNGELIQVTGSNSGSVAGVVLYNHGFILLTGSWDLNSTTNVTWQNWAGVFTQNTGSLEIANSSSFQLNFEGVNYISTITMLAHAKKNEFNYSNNPTYLKFGENTKYTFDQYNSYYEPDNLEIKNTKNYGFPNFTSSLEKQTFITKIGIYDKEKKLIAVAKLANPVKKTESRDFTFKLKLDI